MGTSFEVKAADESSGEEEEKPMSLVEKHKAKMVGKSRKDREMEAEKEAYDKAERLKKVRWEIGWLLTSIYFSSTSGTGS